jgi:hypothetical protein
MSFTNVSNIRNCDTSVEYNVWDILVLDLIFSKLLEPEVFDTPTKL